MIFFESEMMYGFKGEVGEDDDLVIPIGLADSKREGKDVTLIELKGEDHWLSRSKTRVRTLSESLDFIERHIGN